MDLKSFLPGKDIPSKEEYWALVIEPEWVQAGIWGVEEGKAEVKTVSRPAAWQEDGELLSACDAALSSAIQALPEDAPEPSKTVFGVTASWVENGEIKPEYLEKIKVVCSKLELTPVGFVVLQEAISHFIKSEEGAPLNAVVIFLGALNIEVSVFKMGSQVGNMQVARSVSVIDDIVEGLSRFSEASPFPSRIILYDGKEGELEDEKQVVINTDWKAFEKVQFLHAPKVETIDPEKKVLAVCLAGGLEMAMVDKVSLATQEEAPVTEESKIKGEVENVVSATAPDLGFYVNEDVSKKETPSTFTPPAAVPQPPRSGLIDKLKKSLPKFKRPQFGGRLSFGGGGSKKILIAGIVGLVIFFAAGFAFWWYSPVANIKIYVSPQNIEETTPVTVDAKAGSVDVAGKIIPGEVVIRKESGEKEKRVTGSKIIGDKAKGEIKLYRSGGEVKLPAGTTVTSSGGLVFTLDSETVIASGSASAPGTKTASVTAQKIGTESNLPSGTSFSLSNYPASDMEGKSEAAFSGGTSREIAAVSEDDQKELAEGLTLELKDKVLSDIESSLADDKYLIRESIKMKVKDQTFSAKVGDEAANIKLDLSVEGTALIINRSDLFTFGKEILGPKVAKDYVLRDDKLEAEFEYLSEKDGRYELKAILKALLLPVIDTDEIKKNIAGKYRGLAIEYLNRVSSISGAEITLDPKFPGRLAVMPRILKNINIEIDTK